MARLYAPQLAITSGCAGSIDKGLALSLCHWNGCHDAGTLPASSAAHSPLRGLLPPRIFTFYFGTHVKTSDEVGALLSVLAAAVSSEGRMMVIGTGVGAGTTWIVSGLTDRTDVEVVTVENDSQVARIAMLALWPEFVRFVVAEILTTLDELGTFDLIFADAQGGKWFGLDRTIGAVQPGGHLIVDDMEPCQVQIFRRQQDSARVSTREAIRPVLRDSRSLPWRSLHATGHWEDGGEVRGAVAHCCNGRRTRPVPARGDAGLSGSKITSRGSGHPAIFTEQAPQASCPLDLAPGHLDRITAGSWRA
jgi:predicted O-methyltransferase YrrM